MNNGCNGNCYQGRWCECKESEYLDKEHKKELFKAGIAAYVLSITIFTIVYFGMKLFQ